MSDAPEPALRALSVDEDVGVIRLFPSPVVWCAGLIIFSLAAFGLYQGVHGAMTGGSANGGQGEPQTGDAVSAQAAAALPGNTAWSTLNGPAMGPAAAPKTVSSAPANNTDNSDDSDEPESAAPVAASATPPPVSAQPTAQSTAPAPESAQAPIP